MKNYFQTRTSSTLMTAFSYLKHTKYEAEKNGFLPPQLSSCSLPSFTCCFLPGASFCHQRCCRNSGHLLFMAPLHPRLIALCNNDCSSFLPIWLFNIMLRRLVYWCAGGPWFIPSVVSWGRPGALLPDHMENFIWSGFACYFLYPAESICKWWFYSFTDEECGKGDLERLRSKLSLCLNEAKLERLNLGFLI